MSTLKLAVFISGGGTNLQSIIDATRDSSLDADIRLVLSSKTDAYGLIRAEKAEIPAIVLSSKDYNNRDDFVRAMINALESYEVDTIALAGYLRKIPPEIVEKFAGRIVNIHPGPLPRFGGKGMFGIRVHEAVLKSDLKETCVTVHHVTEDYDEGSIIATREVDILPDDTPETLQARVLKVEHNLYPEALQRLAKDD